MTPQKAHNVGIYQHSTSGLQSELKLDGFY